MNINIIEGKMKDKEQKLTDKERIFCHEVIIDWNATRAAIAAGYSEKSARGIGCENRTKHHIKQYIESIKNNFEEEAGISKLMVINEHRKMAFTSIAHIHDTWIDLTEFKNLSDSVKSCISEIQTQVIKRKSAIGNGEFEVLDVEQVKVKLFDKQKSLDSISKLMGYDQETKIDIKSDGHSIAPITWVANESAK